MIGYVVHHILLSFAALVQVHEDYPRRERRLDFDTGVMWPARRAQS
jgi:hypothetical protein